MSFPTVTESGGQNGPSTSHTLTLPSFATGDLVICHTFVEGISQTQTWTYVTSTTSFTQLFQTSLQAEQDCRYRVMQSSDSGSLVITHSSSSQLAYSFFVIPAATFSGVPEAAYSTASYSNSPDPPSLSPSWGSADTLWLALSCNYGAVTTYPTSYTALGYQSGNVAVVSSKRTNATATEDPSTYVWTPTWYSGASTIAIKPASPDFTWDGSGSTVDAVISKTITPTFTANAVIRKAGSGSLTADAVKLATVTVNGSLGDPGVNVIDAVIGVGTSTVEGTFAANAVIAKTLTPTFAANAVLAKSGSGSFIADAVLAKSASGTFTAAAIIGKTQPGSLTFNAVIKASVAGTKTADAIQLRTFWFGRVEDGF